MKKEFCLVHFISQEPYTVWLSFMVHLCKMMISPGVSFIFSKFWFSWLLGGRSVKGKKWSKMRKNSVYCAPYLRNHTSYDFHWWYSGENDNAKISKFWFFGLLGGSKAKIAQNENKLFPLHCISLEPFIIWLCFLLHNFKMMTSPDAFFILSKFWFSGLLGGGGKRAKNSPKWQKNSV